MASQKQLEATQITRKSDSDSQVPAPPLTMVATGRQRSYRPTITPNKTCSANLYRRIKRRVERSLKRTHCKRVLVTTGKQAAYKLSGTKSNVSCLERVSRPLCRQDSTCGNRQHHSSILHKQGRRHEIGPTLCPIMENLGLVHQDTSDAQNSTHSRPAECGSRQAIQARPDHSNRVVSPSRSFPGYLQQVAPAQVDLFATRFNNKLPLFVSPVPDPLATAVDALSLPWDDLDPCAFPSAAILGKVVEKLQDTPCKENHSDYPGVAQHALVLGSGGHVQSSPSNPARRAQSIDTAFQSDPSQESDKPKSPCMAPKASAIKEQGFSEAVAARIEAPQRGSTRSVCEAKWTIFTKWCLTNKVDFRHPL